MSGQLSLHSLILIEEALQTQILHLRCNEGTVQKLKEYADLLQSVQYIIEREKTKANLKHQ